MGHSCPDEKSYSLDLKNIDKGKQDDFSLSSDETRTDTHAIVSPCGGQDGRYKDQEHCAPQMQHSKLAVIQSRVENQL